MPAITYDDAFRAIGEILEDLDEGGGEGGAVAPDARLIDLGLESISLVYLVSELQQRYGLGDGLFRRLRDDGLLLRDMRVGDVVATVVALGASPGLSPDGQAARAGA